MAVAQQPAQHWAVTATLVHVSDTRQARRWTLLAATAVAAGLLLMSGIVRLPLLVAAVSVGPAGLSSPMASLVAPLAGPFLLLGRVIAVLCGSYALLRIVSRLVAPDIPGMTAAALLIGLSWLVAGPGLISGASSIGDMFNPTQAATALVMLALAFLLDRRPIAGVGMLGLVFSAQPEVALWGAIVLAGASAGLAWDRARLARLWLAGGLCALVLATPAAVWGIHMGGFVPAGLAADGLLPLPPWLPWSVPMANWVLGACMLAVGFAAFSALGPDGRTAQCAFAGGVLVLVCGCVMPLLAQARWLLALRPIGADAVLQPLAITAVAAVLARDLVGRGGVLRVALSVIAAASLLLHPFLLPLAALAMLARAAAAHGELLGIERRIRDWDRVVLTRAALAALVLAGVAGVVLRNA